MKKTISIAAIFLLLAGMAIAQDASPSSTSTSSTVTLITATTTTTQPAVLVTTTLPIETTTTTTIPPGAVPVLISVNEEQAKTFCLEHGNGNPTFEDINGTLTGFCTLTDGTRCGLLAYMNGDCPAGATTTSTTLTNTTTTIPTPPTIPDLPTEMPPQPTTTIIVEVPTTVPIPVCGNLYQEVGEECDTMPSSCGEGRWECSKDCKCVKLPDETTTSTLASASAISDIKLPESMKNIDPIYLVAGLLVLIIAIVVVVWYLGGDKEHKKDGQ